MALAGARRGRVPGSDADDAAVVQQRDQDILRLSQRLAVRLVGAIRADVRRRAVPVCFEWNSPRHTTDDAVPVGRLVDRQLRLTAHRRGNSRTLSSSEQRTAVERLVEHPTLSARDRLVAILVLVFGQQIENVVRLTWDHVDVTDDLVTIRLGAAEVALPLPLDEPLRELAADRGQHRTAAHPETNWVFRGYNPGQHIHPGHLRTRRRREFSARAAQLGTLHELTRLAPAPTIAEALGYSPKPIERHAVASATTYSQYIAAVRTRPSKLTAVPTRRFQPAASSGATNQRRRTPAAPPQQIRSAVWLVDKSARTLATPGTQPRRPCPRQADDHRAFPPASGDSHFELGWTDEQGSGHSPSRTS